MINPAFIRSLRQLLSIVMLGFVLLSCTSPAQKLDFNNTKIYFTDQISFTEVQKFGEYLIQSEYANGHEKRIHLSRNFKTGNYVIKAVTENQPVHSEMYRVKAKITAKQCSDLIFNKIPVDFQYCNRNFNTIRTIPFKS